MIFFFVAGPVHPPFAVIGLAARGKGAVRPTCDTQTLVRTVLTKVEH